MTSVNLGAKLHTGNIVRVDTTQGVRLGKVAETDQDTLIRLGHDWYSTDDSEITILFCEVCGIR